MIIPVPSCRASSPRPVPAATTMEIHYRRPRFALLVEFLRLTIISDHCTFSRHYSSCEKCDKYRDYIGPGFPSVMTTRQCSSEYEKVKGEKVVNWSDRDSFQCTFAGWDTSKNTKRNWEYFRWNRRGSRSDWSSRRRRRRICVKCRDLVKMWLTNWNW